MKKIVSFVVTAVVLFVLVFWYLLIGKKAVDEGKTVVETSRQTINTASQGVNELNKVADQQSGEADKLLNGEKK
jgi:hypothetical protein